MTDIVYTVGTNSHWKDKEIAFSLRSIEKHLTNYGRVFIIGHKPDFLQNVIHIPANDPHNIADRNIMEKLLIACDTPEISETFLFFNDDHYLLSDYNAEKFPYYYSEPIKNYIQRRGKDGYGLRMFNTMEYLKARNKPALNFDIHTPILYNKQEFKRIFTRIDWTTQKHGYVLKSLYANILNIRGERMADTKIQFRPKGNQKILSSYPQVNGSMMMYLFESFPKQSIFEMWDVKAEHTKKV